MPRFIFIALTAALLVGLVPAQDVPAKDPGSGEAKKQDPGAKPAPVKPVVEVNGNGHGTPPAKPPAPGEAPKIGCNNPQYDFGEAGQFEEVIHDYEIQNVGKGELQIISANGSCGCTAVAPDKKILKPGEKGLINVKLSTQGTQGAISKTVTVTTNDPVTPSYVLTISGRVAQPFRPSVTELNFGAVKKGQKAEPKSFDVVTNSSQSIVDVKTDNEQIKAFFEVLAATGKQQGYKITVTLGEGLPVGQLRSMLTITTTVPSQKVLTVPVLAQVEGEVSLKPRTFNWGKIKRADAPTKVVEIEKSGASDLKIESVEVKPEGAFTAKVEEVAPGKSYRVVLAISPDAKDGYSRGTMTIKTNCPGETELQVYFYALLQQ